MKTKQYGFVRAAIKSGLVVGILDAIAASVNAYVANGITPDRVFRFVASGALGQDAYTGGISMVYLGLAFHFAIAMGWTILFFFVFFKLAPLQMNKIVLGIIYGLFIWLIMNFIVIPISSIGSRPFPLVGTIIMILIHMFVIGVPISIFAAKSYKVSDS